MREGVTSWQICLLTPAFPPPPRPVHFKICMLAFNLSRGQRLERLLELLSITKYDKLLRLQGNMLYLRYRVNKTSQIKQKFEK